MADFHASTETDEPDSLLQNMAPTVPALNNNDMIPLPTPTTADQADSEEAAADTSRSPSPIPQKTRGRNPRQNPTPKQQQPKQNPSLRPAKDILSRIRHDPSLDEDEFIIGYHDRHAPLPMEIDVSAWKGGLTDLTDEEWIPQHRILYFRKRGEEGRRMWDRERRLDRFFGSGVVGSDENVVKERGETVGETEHGSGERAGEEGVEDRGIVVMA